MMVMVCFSFDKLSMFVFENVCLEVEALTGSE